MKAGTKDKQLQGTNMHSLPLFATHSGTTTPIPSRNHACKHCIVQLPRMDNTQTTVQRRRTHGLACLLQGCSLLHTSISRPFKPSNRCRAQGNRWNSCLFLASTSDDIVHISIAVHYSSCAKLCKRISVDLQALHIAARV